jgi:small subunit ribosomal protein S2
VERLNELEKWESSGVFKAISKKEASRLTKEMVRLQKLLGGIRDMKVLPDVVFVIDPVDTAGAVRESYTLGIPVVAVCDTNADPDMISVPVPGNDDAARSIKLFCAAMADSILEGRAEVENTQAAKEDKPVENPVMAQAFESAMLAAEQEEQEKEAAQAEEPAAEVKVEEKAEEVKEEAKEDKPKAKKTTAKKTTTAKKPAAKKTEEVKEEAKEDKPKAKKTTAKKTTAAKKPAAKKAEETK